MSQTTISQHEWAYGGTQFVATRDGVFKVHELEVPPLGGPYLHGDIVAAREILRLTESAEGYPGVVRDLEEAKRRIAELNSKAEEQRAQTAAVREARDIAEEREALLREQHRLGLELGYARP